MYCANCGQPVSGEICAHCGAAVSAGSIAVARDLTVTPELLATNLSVNERGERSIRGNALTWPFHQHHWWTSIWMPMTNWFWFFGFPRLLSIGWANDAIRRRVHGDVDLLPRISDLGTHFKVGVVVLVMGFVYLVLPGMVASWILQVLWWEHLSQILHLLSGWVTGHAPPNFGNSLRNNVLDMISDASAQFVFGLIAIPLFIIARIRYAVTGRISSFFRLFSNIWLSFMNIANLLVYFFVACLLLVAINFLNGLLLFTVIGLVIPIVLSGVNIWMLTYFAAPIARCVLEHEKKDSL